MFLLLFDTFITRQIAKGPGYQLKIFTSGKCVSRKDFPELDDGVLLGLVQNDLALQWLVECSFPKIIKDIPANYDLKTHRNKPSEDGSMVCINMNLIISTHATCTEIQALNYNSRIT